MSEDQTTGADNKPDTEDIDDIQVETVTRDEPEKTAAPEKTDEAEKPDATTSEESPEDGKEERRKVERLPKWAEDKLAEASFKAREEARQRKELEDKLKRFEDAERRQAQPTEADADAARASAPNPGGQNGGYASKADFDAAVQAEAARREQLAHMQADQQKFDEASNAAYLKGKQDFGDDFDAVVANLGRVGFMPTMDNTGALQNRDLLDLVLASDDPSRVLYELGSDPTKAIELIQMAPQKRALEIAKMGMPKPKQQTPISRAPRPVDPVEGSARVTMEPRDDDDDATWFKKREAELKARA